MDFSYWIIAQAGGGELMSTIFMFGFIFLIFYFILIRPQKKEMERHQSLLSGLKVGDEVVTAGGLFGKVASVEGSIVQLEIARGTKIKVEKQKIQKTQSDLESASAGSAKSDDKKDDQKEEKKSDKKKKGDKGKDEQW